MPDVESTAKKEQSRRVRDMFASIARRYDLLNHLLSGNVDKRWRRLVANRVYSTLTSDLHQSELRVLDVACGTGDLSLVLRQQHPARVIGVDFCRPMLEIAQSKSATGGVDISFVEGDALDLPFRDAMFDATTIAFGLRNLTSVEAGFKELRRILKPDGVVAVLEFSKPSIPILRGLFKFYFTRCLPIIGGWISGSKNAYQYLPDTVSRFPDQEELASLMRTAGFENVSFQNLTGGIAALHIGTRPR